MDDSRLRVGIVGCGGIARGLYVRVYALVADIARVVAVADLEEARRTAAGFEESDGFIRADSLASVLREDLGDRVALLNSRSAALRVAATEW